MDKDELVGRWHRTIRRYQIEQLQTSVSSRQERLNPSFNLVNLAPGYSSAIETIAETMHHYTDVDGDFICNSKPPGLMLSFGNYISLPASCDARASSVPCPRLRALLQDQPCRLVHQQVDRTVDLQRENVGQFAHLQ